MTTKLIWITPDAEKLIAYCARVSNPQNQDNPDYEKLLKYCMDHGHWSIFQMASACFEIETTRAISPQILRHSSFSFQEFSLRYSKATEVKIEEARRQDLKNKQNSISDLSPEVQQWFKDAQAEVWDKAKAAYDKAIELGVAKECSRGLLPMNTKTTLMMSGNIRSWIHYFNLRCATATQKEHRDLALSMRAQLMEHLPIISKSAGWNV
jgi:thymidylate synthase (FAD)